MAAYTHGALTRDPKKAVAPTSGHSNAQYQRQSQAQRQAGGPAFVQRTPEQMAAMQAHSQAPQQQRYRYSPGVYGNIPPQQQHQQQQMQAGGGVSAQDQAWAQQEKGSYGQPGQPFPAGAIGHAAGMVNQNPDNAFGVGSALGQMGGQPGIPGGQGMNQMSAQQMAMAAAPQNPQGFYHNGMNRIDAGGFQGMPPQTGGPLYGRPGMPTQPMPMQGNPQQNAMNAAPQPYQRVSPGVYRGYR